MLHLFLILSFDTHTDMSFGSGDEMNDNSNVAIETEAAATINVLQLPVIDDDDIDSNVSNDVCILFVFSEFS